MEFLNKDVLNKFKFYPNNIREKLKKLRTIIYEVAEENNIEIVESLKWGEPSYSSKYGSTIRIDWKEKFPEKYSIFFNCQTTLVETFKEIYFSKFKFIRNREIYFNIDDEIPLNELKKCILLALTYHNLKHIPLLGE